MPIYGDLRTVSLTELLRWAAKNEKTGVLEIERNAISRRVEFRKGWVGSCSSNDPSARLGQFLLSRGRLSEIQLQHLLTLQKVANKRLGLLVVEMGVLTRQELAEIVASKAQETIHSLFDWDDAFFRFDDGATLDPDQIEVHLSVDDLIAEGRRRSERLESIRRVFETSGAVLQRTELPVPEELIESSMTRRIVDSINGQRTIAEILLHTRASEFPVLRLLHSLHERGLLTIERTSTTLPDNPTLLDDRDGPTATQLDIPIAIGEVDRALQQLAPEDSDGDGGLEAEISAATRLLDQGEFEPAVELLRSSCRKHATDYVRRLLLRAETSFVTSVREDTGFAARIPTLLKDRRMLSQRDTSPEESFMLSLVDGITDVQSILWLAPLREVDALIALRRMERKGTIDLAEPPVTANVASDPVAAG